MLFFIIIVSTLTQIIYKASMPKITPFLQEVVFLVADFLTSIQYTKVAQKLKKQFELPQWVKKDNPVVRKGLKKVLKQYINDNQKVFKYYKNRKPESEQQVESGSQVQTPKPAKKHRESLSPKQSPLIKQKSPKTANAVPQQTKPKGWVASQFQQPKRLEDLNENYQLLKQQPEVVIPQKVKKNNKKIVNNQSSSEQSQQSIPKPKKQKKQIKKQKKAKKVKGPVDTSYLNSEDEFDLEDKQVKKLTVPAKKSVQKKVQTPKNAVNTRKRSAQIQQNEVKAYKAQVKQSNFNNDQQNGQGGKDGYKKFFSRINQDQVGFIPQNRRNNTFQAKAKYGAGDAWGQYGHEKLRDTRGESFKKTKGKLKNKAFQGSGINMNQINSVPIL